METMSQKVDTRPRNRARCTICDEVIESKHVHDFVECTGKHFFIDGGREYVRYGGEHLEALEWVDDQV